MNQEVNRSAVKYTQEVIKYFVTNENRPAFSGEVHKAVFREGDNTNIVYAALSALTAKGILTRTKVHSGGKQPLNQYHLKDLEKWKSNIAVQLSSAPRKQGHTKGPKIFWDAYQRRALAKEVIRLRDGIGRSMPMADVLRKAQNKLLEPKYHRSLIHVVPSQYQWLYELIDPNSELYKEYEAEKLAAKDAPAPAVELPTQPVESSQEKWAPQPVAKPEPEARPEPPTPALQDWPDQALRSATVGQLIDEFLSRISSSFPNLLASMVSAIPQMPPQPHAPEQPIARPVTTNSYAAPTVAPTQQPAIEVERRSQKPQILIMGVRKQNHIDELINDFPHLDIEMENADIPPAMVKAISRTKEKIIFLVDNVTYRRANDLRDANISFVRVEGSIGALKGKLTEFYGRP